MLSTKTLWTGIIMCCHVTLAVAQSDSATAYSTQRALIFADRFVQANFNQQWNVLASLSCPSAIKYYGGKEGFREHVVEAYYSNEPMPEEKPESVEMFTIMSDTKREWQCVVERIRNSFGEQARSYLLGQSTDNGRTWKFVEVSRDNIHQLVYIVPSLFGSLYIPERKIVSSD